MPRHGKQSTRKSQPPRYGGRTKCGGRAGAGVAPSGDRSGNGCPAAPNEGTGQRERATQNLGGRMISRAAGKERVLPAAANGETTAMEWVSRWLAAGARETTIPCGGCRSSGVRRGAVGCVGDCAQHDLCGGKAQRSSSGARRLRRVPWSAGLGVKL
jgi:hypothetical protein